MNRNILVQFNFGGRSGLVWFGNWVAEGEFGNSFGRLGAEPTEWSGLVFSTLILLRAFYEEEIYRNIYLILIKFPFLLDYKVYLIVNIIIMSIKNKNSIEFHTFEEKILLRIVFNRNNKDIFLKI